MSLAPTISLYSSFYYCKGASADFCEADIRWDALDVDILHIGYILLMDALDAPDAEYGTRLARLLNTARRRGIRTSVDMVTEPGERTRRVAAPALKYADYCVINESEAQALTGVRLADESGKLIRENVTAALEAMKAMGVSTWAVPDPAPGLHQGLRGRGRRLLLRRALRRLEGLATAPGHRIGHRRGRLLPVPARRHRGHARLRRGDEAVPGIEIKRK